MPALRQHLSPCDWPASTLTSPDWLDGSPDSHAKDLRVQTGETETDGWDESSIVCGVYSLRVCVCESGCVHVFRVGECVCVDAGLYSQLSSCRTPVRDREQTMSRSVARFLKVGYGFNQGPLDG